MSYASREKKRQYKKEAKAPIAEPVSEMREVLARDLICGDIVIQENGSRHEVDGINIEDDKIEVNMRYGVTPYAAEFDVDQSVTIVA